MKTPLLSAVLVILLSSAPVLAQQRDGTVPRISPNASTSFTLGVTDIAVLYGAPSVRDRDIFGELVPFDEVWRTGANEATVVTFSNDVMVEGEFLSAGTYGLFTIPRAGDWSVIFSSDPEQWGSFQYNPDRSEALRVEVSPQSADVRETMSVMFEDFEMGDESDAVTLVIHWDDVRLPIRIETDTNSNVVARAERAVEQQEWANALTYSRYALQTDRNLDRATGWIEAVMEHDESYGALAIAARLHAARGDIDRAVELGERAIEMATTMRQQPQGVDSLRRDVAAWRDHR